MELSRLRFWISAEKLGARLVAADLTEVPSSKNALLTVLLIYDKLTNERLVLGLQSIALRTRNDVPKEVAPGLNRWTFFNTNTNKQQNVQCLCRLVQDYYSTVLFCVKRLDDKSDGSEECV